GEEQRQREKIGQKTHQQAHRSCRTARMGRQAGKRGPRAGRVGCVPLYPDLPMNSSKPKVANLTEDAQRKMAAFGRSHQWPAVFAEDCQLDRRCPTKSGHLRAASPSELTYWRAGRSTILA